ncbi:hypothetical protein SERLA73DRAFT_102681 [Serpula lacrymans var. lacrymans S7.3]|uniref:Las1-domain-containing protein n=2 Tax=Serpula lacrymans var. lacrymans TaxID=341189 RepID=F8PMB1_SERL3|nr:uncharacterized protein SERLADRAFT_413344 [Serpula lacrymans var. lacrymans S7.9]EGO02743.1 hypothetical protein SERLA73DRAFT_102681 [Serpula lacrymans var. lacrymans S7.3]EGO28444.1 hypothetical protein SERLADRAFT_413344 [Serpula lacrymans var. lacrymans S7.9]
MRLPRRVPWRAIAELDQVCSWIFADENDIDAKEQAVNRLIAWKAVTSLPHALESTLMILSVTLLDFSLSQKSSASANLHLRQSYATAVIRLVNGLVDPLQVGAYARSIAAIAAQLGLPPWLVELRHAATHEELPSLELLREAARESLSWLFNHYFLPTLNPSSSSPSSSAFIRPVSPLLKRYKALLKLTIRDASVRNQYKPDIEACLRDIERWIAEGKVAASTSTDTLGWDDYMSRNDEDEDVAEKWALDRLCVELMERGALVPLSKRKRVPSTDEFWPQKENLSLWTPLLSHLQTHHSGFSSVLTNRILSHLLSEQAPVDVTLDVIQLDPEEPGVMHMDISYDMCLARWIAWVVNVWNSDREEGDYDPRKEIYVRLAAALAPGNTTMLTRRKTLTSLLNALSQGNAELEKATALLIPNSDNVKCQQWHQDDLAEMDKRLHILVSCDPINGKPDDVPEVTVTASSESHETSHQESLPLGWRSLSPSSSWKPCPIGLYVTGES